jgi:thiosulfate/3-mercaptopyruvate sulfurtransferase
VHITGTIFFDVEKISNQTSNLPHMLPSEKAFAVVVSSLGIENNDKMIIYDDCSCAVDGHSFWS